MSSEFGMVKSIDNVIFYIQPTLFFVEMIKFVNSRAKPPAMLGRMAKAML